MVCLAYCRNRLSMCQMWRWLIYTFVGLASLPLSQLFDFYRPYQIPAVPLTIRRPTSFSIPCPFFLYRCTAAADFTTFTTSATYWIYRCTISLLGALQISPLVHFYRFSAPTGRTVLSPHHHPHTDMTWKLVDALDDSAIAERLNRCLTRPLNRRRGPWETQ